MALALLTVLWRERPISVMIDGTSRSIWMIFIGNCEYSPPGLAPIRRQQLDDGLFDVRWVEDLGPCSRLYVVVAALSGRVDRSTVFHRELVDTLTIESSSGPLRVARDGETFTGSSSFTVVKSRTRQPSMSLEVT